MKLINSEIDDIMKTLLIAVGMLTTNHLVGQQVELKQKRLERQASDLRTASYVILGTSGLTSTIALIMVFSSFSKLEADPYSDSGGRLADNSEKFGYIAMATAATGTAIYLVSKAKKNKAASLSIGNEKATLLNYQKLRYQSFPTIVVKLRLGK